MSCLLCATYYFNQSFPLPWQTKRTSFQGLSFSDRYCKQKLQDVLLLYTNLIGINVIIIIIIIVSATGGSADLDRCYVACVDFG